jgi:hypothetical protein
MVRDALQSIKIIESKPKFDSRREILTKYKNGLIKDKEDLKVFMKLLLN